MTQEMVLYFSPGACSRVTLIALNEVGAPYTTHLIKFARGDHRSAEYLKLNPKGQVPTLVVDGKPLTENVAIITWLDKKYPQARLLPVPADDWERAEIMSKLIYFPAGLHPLVTRNRLPNFFCDLPEGIVRVKAMAQAAMAGRLEMFEAQLAKEPWILGSDWSILDGYFYWVCFRLGTADFDFGPFPNVSDHLRRSQERPSVQAALKCDEAAFAELDRDSARSR